MVNVVQAISNSQERHSATPGDHLSRLSLSPNGVPANILILQIGILKMLQNSYGKYIKLSSDVTSFFPLEAYPSDF